jgi:hypothetical protein
MYLGYPEGLPPWEQQTYLLKSLCDRLPWQNMKVGVIVLKILIVIYDKITRWMNVIQIHPMPSTYSRLP